MMTLSGLLVFGVALAVAAGSPGPSIAALVARVVGRGLGSVLPFLAAMWVGEVVWLTAAVAGLSALAQAFGTLFLIIKLAGVAYLLYLAWCLWVQRQDGDQAAEPTPQRAWPMFAAGLAVTLGNPKIMVFYMALLPTLVDLHHVGVTGWAQLCGVAVLVLAVVDVGWAVAAARARRLLRSPRAMCIAQRTSASVMAGAAVAIATR